MLVEPKFNNGDLVVFKYDKKRDMDKYLKLFYKVLEEDKKDEEKA